MRVLPVGIGIIGDFNFLFAYLNFLNVHYGKGEMGPFFLIKKKKNHECCYLFPKFALMAALLIDMASLSYCCEGGS